MSVIALKYCLPALLGYILFIGISGRFNPFNRPAELVHRPSWFFGLWTGVAVAAVLTLGLHMAYSMTLESVRHLFVPSATVLAALLIAGLCGFLWYRSSVNQTLAGEASTSAAAGSWSLQNNALAERADRPADTISDESVEALALNKGEAASAISDKDINSALDSAAEMLSDDEFDATLAFAEYDDTEAESGEFSHPDATPEATTDVNSAVGTPNSAVHAPEGPPMAMQSSELKIDSNTQAELHSLSIDNAGTPTELTAIVDDQLKGALEQEIQLRQETEKHLRITRKALAVLESESRSYEMSKAEALTHLEEELENRIRQTAKAEARGNREAAKRLSLEADVVSAKQQLSAAKTELRKNTTARAKALATADRAVTFAKQAINARSVAEHRVKELEATLSNRQSTISSLIQSLEKEKRRTQNEIQVLAKQMLMEEKQIRARRRLDEAARRVEGKLANRLVKKVARSRPVTAG